MLIFIFNIALTTTIYKSNMPLITLDVPPDLHVKIKQIQLKGEADGNRKNLKDIYYEVIKKGIEQIEKENPTK